MLADPEEQACNDQACEIDCEGEWGEWGDCVAACTDSPAAATAGSRQRVFSVRQRAEFGGQQATCGALDGDIEAQNCSSTAPCVRLGLGDMDDDGWLDQEEGELDPDGDEVPSCSRLVFPASYIHAGD